MQSFCSGDCPKATGKLKFMVAWNACGMTAVLYSENRMDNCDVQEIQWASHMATVEKKAMHTEFLVGNH